MNKEIIIEMRKAIKRDDLNTIRELIKNNEGILNVVTVFGTFLHDAANSGFIDVVQLLEESGIDINCNGGVRDGSALTVAAFNGHMEVINYLYNHGAILDVSTFARNPLFAAIYNDHFDVVKFLVEKGIDIKASYPIGDIDHCDAYEYARQYGRTEIANYLKERMSHE